jgi:hypothetical protein
VKRVSAPRGTTLLFGALILFTGCAEPARSAPPSTDASRVEPSAGPTQSPTHSASPVVTSPPTASTTPVAWTQLERTIRAGIREDAAKRCVPRRHDLPPGTIAAVECAPRAAVVARVGSYLFASPDQAFDHYRSRIRAEELTYNSDASRFGSVGSAAGTSCMKGSRSNSTAASGMRAS